MRSLAAALVAIAALAACALSDAGYLGDNQSGWNFTASFALVLFAWVVLFKDQP